MPRSSAASDARKHNPLDQDYISTGILRNKPSKKKSKNDDGDDDENFVDSKASKKILRIGQELANEDEQVNEKPQPNAAFDFNSRIGGDADDEEAEFGEEEAWGDEEEEVEEIEMNPEDAEVFRKFNPEEVDTSLDEALARQGWGSSGGNAGGQGTDLAAIILEEIARKEAAGGPDNDMEFNSAMPEDDFEIPERVVEVYTKYAIYATTINVMLI